MARVLDRKSVRPLLESLMKRFEVWAPAKSGSHLDFRRISSPEEAVLDYGTTMMPPKVALMPDGEPLLQFDGKTARRVSVRRKILLFGVHPRDARAISIIDLSMLGDFSYRRRRRNTAVVCVTPLEDEEDFSAAFGAAEPADCDLMLHRQGGYYVAEPFSGAGSQIARSKFFASRSARATKRSRLGGALNLKMVSEAIEEGPDKPLWEELGKKCLGCGICTLVCPVCHCFDLRDFVGHGQIERRRHWDSCLYEGFSKVAGGHVFRQPLGLRLWYWYHHKFVRAPKEIGVAECVGCGRCTRYCPAGISIRDNLRRLLE